MEKQQLNEMMVRNEELERQNAKLKHKSKGYAHGGGGMDNSFNSQNDPYRTGSGSYDADDRSYNDNSFSQAKAEAAGSRALVESLQEEKAQM